MEEIREAIKVLTAVNDELCDARNGIQHKIDVNLNRIDELERKLLEPFWAICIESDCPNFCVGELYEFGVGGVYDKMGLKWDTYLLEGSNTVKSWNKIHECAKMVKIDKKQALKILRENEPF